MRALPTLAFAAALAGACGGTEASSPASPSGGAASSGAAVPGPSRTDVAGLKTAIDAGGAVVVDVRTPGEFAAGHVPGAINIPVDEVAARASELQAHRDGPIYLVCAVGGRSATATRILADEGFSRPINVDGGTRAWQAAGYPIE